MHVIIHSFIIIIFWCLCTYASNILFELIYSLLQTHMFTSATKKTKKKTCGETINAAADVSLPQVARETICTEPVASFIKFNKERMSLKES